MWASLSLASLCLNFDLGSTQGWVGWERDQNVLLRSQALHFIDWDFGSSAVWARPQHLDSRLHSRSNAWSCSVLRLAQLVDWRTSSKMKSTGRCHSSQKSVHLFQDFYSIQTHWELIVRFGVKNVRFLILDEVETHKMCLWSIFAAKTICQRELNNTEDYEF